MMRKSNPLRKFSRRDFLKLGGSLAAGAAATRFLPKSVAQSGEVALAAGLHQAVTPDIHLAASDGWIHLPGQVAIPGTTDQYYQPDNFAPDYDPLNPSAGLTTYMFGFRNVTGMTPEQIQMQKMKIQASAPLFWVNEGQDYFLRLSNLGLAMRPDLIDSHTLHWHGFRNAYPIFDGEPHSSVAVPIGRNMTLYYKPLDPGTYMYHCHFEETEHVHMGMTGTVFVRPAQDGAEYIHNGKTFSRFAYNDGDGSTGYHREFSLTLTDVWAEAHWDDSHVQLPDWTDFKPEYFLMNGRVWPDTLVPNGGGETATTAWTYNANAELIAPPGRPNLQYQPISSLIEAQSGERILLRLVNLSFQQHPMTIAGLKMRVIGRDATLLRNSDGTNLAYDTNTIYIGVGESYDVVIDLPEVTSTTTYLLYNRNYARLHNAGAPGYGGMMTEIRVHPANTLAEQQVPNTNPRPV